jgi:hypothetical protein
MQELEGRSSARAFIGLGAVRWTAHQVRTPAAAASRMLAA